MGRSMAVACFSDSVAVAEEEDMGVLFLFPKISVNFRYLWVGP